MEQNDNIKNSPLVIEKSASIKTAMEAITANQKGAIAVIDADEKLVGVVSDGDIRRALLREASLITPVEKVMNINYIFCQEGMTESPEEIFRRHKEITVLPVVNKDHKLIDILTI